MQQKKTPITIIGAGLVGCFMAILLTKRGYKVKVFEKTSQDEFDNPISNRSFNMTFQDFGTNVLKNAGVWETIQSVILPLDGSVTMVEKNKKPIFSRVGKNIPYYTVTRTSLVKKFVAYLRQNPLVTFHFDMTLVSLNRYEKTLLFEHTKSKTRSTITYELLIGADGVNSLVRPFVQQGQETDHRQVYETWMYKQITIKKETVERFQWRRDASYTWTRSNATLTAYPTEINTVNALLMMAKNDFRKLTTPNAIKDFITKNFPDVLPALPDIIESVLTNPDGNFVTIYTSPWYYKDTIALIGDAAHGFLPFYGQGMSTGYGDCMEFVKLLDTHGEDWGKILPLYQKARKIHTDTLANLSKGAFTRYRRSTKADYAAVYDKFDSILYNLFPKTFAPPPYVLVAYNPGHAADIVTRHTKQRKRAKFFGVPLLVGAVTGLVAIAELFNRSISSHKD